MLPKNLYLSSLFALLLVSCSPLRGYRLLRNARVDESTAAPVIQKHKSLLYKADIKLYNKRYSGLILLKQTDSSTARLTFVTEIGMKMFDFEIRNNQFAPIYVFEPLNKPSLVKLLEADLSLMLLQNLLHREAGIYEKGNERMLKQTSGYRYYYKMKTASSLVGKTTVKGKLFTKVRVSYAYSDTLSPQQIQLSHQGLLRLRIRMNRLIKE